MDSSTWPWQPENRPVPFRNYPVLRTRWHLAAAAASLLWRRLMVRTRFIAVTGSYGKSTATSCLAAILGSRFPINYSGNPSNARSALAENLLRTRFGHRFTVMEVGTKLPGALRRASLHIDPDIVVVLAVGLQHTNTFPNLDAIAREKASLLRRIGRRRLAILNGDDPRVRAMAAGCKGRVYFFGTTPDCNLWASGVSSRWPARLSFTAHAGTNSARIETQLVGEHWLHTVLGAMACALALGLTLEDCAAALPSVPPILGRLSVHPLPSGVTVWRDDHNASLSCLGPALDALSQVQSGRRVVVMGDVFDSPLKGRERYAELGRMVAKSADIAIFIERHLNTSVRAAIDAGMHPSSARAFQRLEDAANWLSAELRPGDVLLIRARGQFHMERIYFALLGSVGCWMSRCTIHPPCDFCEYLRFQKDLVPASGIKPLDH